MKYIILMDVTFEWYNMKETAVNEKEGNWSRELFLQQGIWTVPLTISLYLKIFAKADNYMGLGGGVRRGKNLYEGGTKFFQQTSL